MRWLACWLILLALGVDDCSGSGTSDVTRYFEQRVDHLDESNHATWSQAYWMDDDKWSGAESSAPIFLKIGGEGPMIPPFRPDFISDMLPVTRGLAFTVEHRYYGCHNASSCPYDVGQPPQNYLDGLTSKQALADLATFQRFATAKYSIAPKTPWILIGGSYPGILAALGRAEYPDLFFAAVASSAPVRGVEDFRDFEDVVSDAYALSVDGIHGSESCRSTIIDAHKQVGELLASWSGRQHLAQVFHLRNASALETDTGRQHFAGCGAAEFPAQTNDPLCNTPVCGITQICELMTDQSVGSPVDRLAKLRRLQNVSGISKNFNLTSVMQNCEMDTLWEDVPSIPMEALFWAFQTCNEYGFYQTCEHGSKCLFVRGLVSFQNRIGARQPDHFCRTQFNITRQETKRRVVASNALHGAKIAAATRILWVNGNVDPWSSRSHHTSPGEEQPVIWPVEGASHCAWMGAAKSGEQSSLVEARAQIYRQLSDWLRQPVPIEGAASFLLSGNKFKASARTVAAAAAPMALIVAFAACMFLNISRRRVFPSELTAPLAAGSATGSA